MVYTITKFIITNKDTGGQNVQFKRLTTTNK